MNKIRVVHGDDLSEKRLFAVFIQFIIRVTVSCKDKLLQEDEDIFSLL